MGAVKLKDKRLSFYILKCSILCVKCDLFLNLTQVQVQYK